jgi:hypothetical protein
MWFKNPEDPQKILRTTGHTPTSVPQSCQNSTKNILAASGSTDTFATISAVPKAISNWHYQ